MLKKFFLLILCAASCFCCLHGCAEQDANPINHMVYYRVYSTNTQELVAVGFIYHGEKGNCINLPAGQTGYKIVAEEYWFRGETFDVSNSTKTGLKTTIDIAEQAAIGTVFEDKILSPDYYLKVNLKVKPEFEVDPLDAALSLENNVFIHAERPGTYYAFKNAKVTFYYQGQKVSCTYANYDVDVTGTELSQDGQMQDVEITYVVGSNYFIFSDVFDTMVIKVIRRVPV